MVGDTRNGEHHEQQQEINDGLLHGLGGRAACNDIRGVRRDRAGDTGHEPCEGIHVSSAGLKASHGQSGNSSRMHQARPMFSTQRSQRILTQSPQSPFALFAFPLRSLRYNIPAPLFFNAKFVRRLDSQRAREVVKKELVGTASGCLSIQTATRSRTSSGICSHRMASCRITITRAGIGLEMGSFLSFRFHTSRFRA